MTGTKERERALRWRETKYAMTRSGLRGSRDLRYLGRGSRLIADIMAREYELALAAYARGDLLDVGCGAAPLYGVYRDRITSSTWVDWRQQDGVPPLDLAHDINTPFPFPSESFDTILATDVVEHLHDPETFFRELTRLLRPGGQLILGAPFMYWVHEAPHDYHRYTRFRLERLCASNALTVERLDAHGGAFEVVLDVIGKVVATSAIASFVHGGLISLLLNSPAHRLFRRRHTETFPLAYVLVARR